MEQVNFEDAEQNNIAGKDEYRHTTLSSAGVDRVVNDDVINVVEEHAVITKNVVETGKVHIHKSVTEEVVSVSLPILNEFYEINHLPGREEVLDAPPPPRREGNITVIPVIKEITVVQKKYIVTEELQLVRRTTQTPLTQELTLRKEHVSIRRSASGDESSENMKK